VGRCATHHALTDRYLQLVAMIALWYSLNVGWNLSNKNLCNLLGLPMTATFMQCTLGTFFMMMTWVLKMRSVPDRSLWSNKQLHGLGAVHAASQLATIGAFSVGSVSFVSVIKSLEPLFSAALGVPLLGDRLPLRVWLSMIPVCAGLAMASMSDVSFTWFCFGLAQVSNFGYALRSVWFKKVFDDANNKHEAANDAHVKADETHPPLLIATTSFPVVTCVGTVIIAAVALSLEGHRLQEGLANVRRAGRTPKDLALLVAMAGFFQYTNDEMSFVVLEVLSAVTQSVANTFKRVFVIAAAAYYFSTPMSLQGITGTAIAVTGMMIYSGVMHGHRQKQKKKLRAAATAAAELAGKVARQGSMQGARGFVRRSLSWLPSA